MFYGTLQAYRTCMAHNDFYILYTYLIFGYQIDFLERSLCDIIIANTKCTKKYKLIKCLDYAIYGELFKLVSDFPRASCLMTSPIQL